MKALNPKIFGLILAALSLMCLGSVSCGGGGGGDSDPVATLETNSLETGSVAILLTDSPTDEFSEINITVTSVELLSDETKVLLFSGEKSLDLLQLQDESSLFATSTDVPALIYNKIRLQLSDMQLVNRDTDGNVTETIHPKLTGNGKLDLNPRSPFVVEPGATLIVQVDLDAEKSIHVHQTGEGDMYLFRPVVFVDIIDGTFTGNLVRLEGFVNEPDPAGKTFLLCQSHTACRAQTVEPDADYGDVDEPPAEYCVTIHTDDTTSLFNAEGDPVGFEVLQEGEKVVAVGRFRTADEDTDNDLTDFDAEVIEIGGSGAFLMLNGTILSPPDEQGAFTFHLDPGQGIIGTVTVLLQEGTGIFSDSGIPLSQSDIEPGQAATIHGVLMVSDLEPDRIKPALIILDMESPRELVQMEGTASNINDEARTFDLVVPAGRTECVKAPADALLFLEPAEVSAASVAEGNVPFETLDEGDAVRVSGYYDATDCLVAEIIRIKTEGEIVIE